VGRLRELCVEHLKTTGYYSNVRVGLCYELSEGDDPDRVFDDLFLQISTYIERARRLSDTAQFTEMVKAQLLDLEKALAQVQALLERVQSLTSDVEDLKEELEKTVRELEESRGKVREARSRLATIKAGLEGIMQKLRGLAY